MYPIKRPDNHNKRAVCISSPKSGPTRDCSHLQNDLVFVAAGELLVRQHNRIQQNLLRRHIDEAAQNRDRWIQLALAVEQRWVLHFGERFVGVRVARRALDACPGTDYRVSTDYFRTIREGKVSVLL